MRGSKTVYILPNLFTTASLFCGFYAILAAIDGSGRFTFAAVLIFVAMIFDGCDGRVARLGVHAGRRVRGAGLGAPRPSRCGQACAGCALGGRLSGGRVPVGGRRRVGRAGASGGFVVCHASSVNKSDPAAAAAPATSMG